MMIKDGNSITTNLITEEDTKEKDGVEVTIKNIRDIFPYRDALKYIVFFPNVYIEGTGNNSINDTKIKKFSNFAVASINIDNKILLGNVLYPCKLDILGGDMLDFMNSIRNSGIVLKFDVGELNITPNRESIIYTKETITKIVDKVNKAKYELENLIKTNVIKDYTDLYEYYLTASGVIAYDLLYNKFKAVDGYMEGGNYRFKPNKGSLTFKGKTFERQDIDIIREFFYSELPKFKGVCYKDTFYNKNTCKSRDYIRPKTNSIIMLRNVTRIPLALKSYLCNNYNNSTILIESTKAEFYSYISTAIRALNLCKNKDILIDYMWEYILSKTKFIDVTNDKNFKDYRKKLDNTAKNNTLEAKECIIYIQRGEVNREKHYFTNIKECTEFLKNKHKGIILTNIQGDNCWFDVARYNNLLLVRARKDIVAILENLNLSYIINKTEYVTKSTKIIKAHTIYKELQDIPMFSKYACEPLLNILPLSLKREFEALLEYRNEKCQDKTYMRFIDGVCRDIDPYTQSICNKFRHYLITYEGIIKELNFNNARYYTLESLLTSAYIMKTKAFRIGYDAYNQVKKNKILRVICKK